MRAIPQVREFDGDGRTSYGLSAHTVYYNRRRAGDTPDQAIAHVLVGFTPTIDEMLVRFAQWDRRGLPSRAPENPFTAYWGSLIRQSKLEHMTVEVW